MQCPFGNDEDDIDLEKLIRRIDTHSAAQCSVYMNTVVPNSNLYPEARSIDVTLDMHRQNAAPLPACLPDCGVKARGNDARELELGTDGKPVAIDIAPTNITRGITRGRSSPRAPTSKHLTAKGIEIGIDKGADERRWLQHTSMHTRCRG
jgi:hypothetical protein